MVMINMINLGVGLKISHHFINRCASETKLFEAGDDPSSTHGSSDGSRRAVAAMLGHRHFLGIKDYVNAVKVCLHKLWALASVSMDSIP